MIRRRGLVWLASALAIAGAAVAAGLTTLGSTATAKSVAPKAWAQRGLTGSVRLTGQVPLVVRHVHRVPAVRTSRLHTSIVRHPQVAATYLRPHPTTADIGLNFSFPLRDKAGLDKLILQEARTHHYLTRAQIYARFSPSQAQYNALRRWLIASGFHVTHVAADRMSITVHAPTSTVEKTLRVKINDYLRSGFTFGRISVQPFRFYANATAPQVPARLGLQAISGLSDIDRFYTDYQLSAGGPAFPDDPGATGARSGGYFPVDLRGLYDVTGHGVDGAGQTIGFTLWTAPERQATMDTYATTTGDQLITVDPSCVATGNSPAVPSSCSTQTVGADHLLNILENGNTDANSNFGSNIETALDIEAAHGVATHVGMKYYASECNPTPPPGSGLGNAGCNGTDVGLEDSIEDAANDPTLHSVSNSWAFGGEAEWGAADPFLLVSEDSFALAAAAGTTFYFSTGDNGTYISGYPSDSQYVVGVGGTSTYSTSDPSSYSTSTTWTGGGSWCSNVIARPAWQTGPGVTANAPCPGRVVPDISAIADPTTGIAFTSTSSTGGIESGRVGGTSLAAPVMNGLEALTANFVAAQSYRGAAPQLGFEAPMLYQLGSSGNADRYYRDIVCGNTANPPSGPDGDAAKPGFDAATGWGEIDWFNFSTGYALALGATNLSRPPSLSTSFGWGCAQTPSNSSERGISFPSSSTGYAVGAASGGTPWPGKFLPGGAWGAVNTFFKTSDGGATWFPSNSDMLSVACTSTTSCLEVGVGGRERRTTDGGMAWMDTPTGYDKPLTQVSCPSALVCYAAGDRGTVLKSTDGGAGWSFLASTGANPIYGLSCPTVAVCYATDIYGHVLKTADGGATWIWQQTPITTPGFDVPGSNLASPFAGLLSISCPSADTCVATGLYATVAGQTPPSTDPPIVTTTDGGTTWVRQTSNAGAGNYLHSVSCLPSTTNCTAVGRSGTIVTTTDLAAWTKVASGTTSLLDAVDCPSASFCIAVGQNGAVDIFNGSTWAATTGNGGAGILAGVTCIDTSTCYAVGKQGITIGTTNGGAGWAIQAGGGTTQQMNSVSCVDVDTCITVGNGGTILRTSNGGELWSPQTSMTTSNLNGVSCVGNACTAVGAGGTVRWSSTGGATWNIGATGSTNALNGVTCNAAGSCVTVGAAGTIETSGNGGQTWGPPLPSGTTAVLNAVTCKGVTCYAVGAGGVILNSTDGGATWSPQTSGTSLALSGIACIDAFNCFAGGAIGTVVTTNNGGGTWTQQGNPLSGPPTALNVTSSGGLALNVVACTPLRCDIGAGSQGDMLTSPMLTVTLNATTPYGAVPAVSGLAADDASIAYSIPSELGNVTGTLTCETTATKSSSPGTFPITSCGGLSDPGFSVVYDYTGSAYVVTRAPLTITADDKSRPFGSPSPPLTATIGGFVNGETPATSDVVGATSCTSAPALAAVGSYPITCTVGTLVSAHDYAFTTFVPGTLNVTSSSPCITSAESGKLAVGSGQAICVGAGGVIAGPLAVNDGGVLDIEGATINGPLRIAGSGVIRICGSAINVPLTISGATGLVLIGGDTATGACAGNTIAGPVELTGNKGGVEFNGNTVNGPLTISGTTGTLPSPDTGSLHVSGNAVTGPIKTTTQ